MAPQDFGLAGQRSGDFDVLKLKSSLGDSGRGGGLGETPFGAGLWPGFSINSGLGEVKRMDGDGLGLGLCQRTLGKTDGVGQSGKVTVLRSPGREQVRRW